MKSDATNFMIEEYKANWTYYMKTQDERKNLFDWFLKIVGLPAAGFGIAIRSGVFYLESVYYGLIFLGITLIGFALYLTYLKETSNSKGYLWCNNRIRNYYREKYPELVNILISDKHSDRYWYLGKIAFWRSSIFLLINTTTALISTFFLLQHFNCQVQRWVLFSASAVVLIIQIILFFIFINSYQLPKEFQVSDTKNKRDEEIKNKPRASKES